MRYELFLALRYLGGLKRQQPFVSAIAIISVLGVALGVAALLVVLGVMSGFDADLESRIVGANPHIRVEMEGGITQVDSLAARLQQLPEVVAVSPFIQTELIVQLESQTEGVILRGVDPVEEEKVTDLHKSLREGVWPPAPQTLVLGAELARRWGVRVGDTVTVLLPKKKPTPRQMQVSGIFSTGYYDYDVHLVLASLETVQELLGTGPVVSGVGVRLKQAVQAPRVKQALQKKLGYPYWVVSWMDLNRNLFAALKLEKVSMFILLSLIVLVACFNIVATLLMMVVQKTKEVGILKAVGATSASIRRIFTWAGLLIGLTGTALGAALGFTLCGLLAKYRFIQLPADIYYIDRLPVKLETHDAALVILAAMVISWVACFYPAWVAARVYPAEAVRYE